jgi:uncharacterized protein YqhQ
VGEFNYGGQAVMEGVMMRGSKRMAVAVRAPNGKIVVRSEPLNQLIYNSRITKVPFLRGVTMLWDTLVLGMRILMYSADVAVQGEDVAVSEDSPPQSVFSGAAGLGSVALAVVMAIGLFFLLPAFLTRLVDPYLGSALLSNLVEGAIRLVIVLAYIWGVGLLPDVERVFQYHGAEHKTIHAYEEGVPLVVEEIQRYTTAHSRCGTAFILVVMVISVLVFALLGRPTLLLRLVSRVVLLPVIVGISYEWLKFSAKYQHRAWMRVLLAPGLVLQKLTTREPDDDMIEVAVAALERVLEADGLPVPRGEPALASESV